MVRQARPSHTAVRVRNLMPKYRSSKRASRDVPATLLTCWPSKPSKPFECCRDRTRMRKVLAFDPPDALVCNKRSAAGEQESRRRARQRRSEEGRGEERGEVGEGEEELAGKMVGEARVSHQWQDVTASVKTTPQSGSSCLEKRGTEENEENRKGEVKWGERRQRRGRGTEGEEEGGEEDKERRTGRRTTTTTKGGGGGGKEGG
eukprot:746820-Hanusia_phi.AAC.5